MKTPVVEYVKVTKWWRGYTMLIHLSDDGYCRPIRGAQIKLLEENLSAEEVGQISGGS